MILYILSFTLLICINSLKSDVINTSYPNGADCEEVDKPGWSFLNLANKTMDTWPWKCLNIRYTESALNKEISKVSPDLFDATAKDYTGFVQYYVERRKANVCYDFNEDGEDGVDALYIAIAKGNLRMVQFMFKYSNARDCVETTRTGFVTPMGCAAMYGHLDILKYLLEEKKWTHYTVDLRDVLKEIVLAAAKRGQQHILKYLVDEVGFIMKPNDGLTLFTAAQGGNLDMLKYLLYEKGMNPRAKLHIHDAFQYNLYRCGNLTLLCNTAVSGKLDAVIFCIEKLNNTEFFKCNNKWPEVHPLVMAVNSGSLPVVKYMIEEKGADYYCRFTYYSPLHTWGDGQIPIVKYYVPDYTLLHLAAGDGHLPIVKYLVELKQMDIDSKIFLRTTPLYGAIMYNRLDVVKYLAGEQNASLNVYPGSNALLVATGSRATSLGKLSGNNVKIVKFLVDDMKMLSRIDEVDESSNRTALMNAAFYGKFGILKFLVDDRHVNTTIVDPTNKTLLHFAAEEITPDNQHDENQLPTLKYLIEEKGFKVSARTTTNETVLDLASKFLKQPNTILTYLIEKMKEETSLKN